LRVKFGFHYRRIRCQNTGGLVLTAPPFSLKLKQHMWKGLCSFLASVRNRSTRREDDPPNRSRITIVALIAGERDCGLLKDVCARNRWSLHFTDTCGEAWTVLNRLKAPVVLCDRDLPGAEWRDVVHMMASSAHGACAILLSRVVDDYLWNEVIGKGGYDVLPKPLREDDIVRSVRLAWSYWNSSARGT
jgi:hypothetical protein